MDIPIRPLPPQQPFVSPPLHERRGLMTVLTVVVLIAVVVGGYVFYERYYAKKSATATRQPPVDLHVLYDQGKTGDLIARVDVVLSQKPTNPASLYALKSEAFSQAASIASSENTLGSQAVDAANQAIALSASSSEAYYALGLANEIAGKYAAAHTAYAKTLTIEPRKSVAIVGDGRIYELEGNITKAKAQYQAALAANPKTLGADLGLGRIEIKQNDVATARVEFEKVWSSSPNVYERAQASYALAILALAPSSTIEANSRFIAADSLAPGYASAAFGQGIVYYLSAVASTTTNAQTKEGYIQGLSNSFLRVLALAGDTPSSHSQLVLDLALVQGTAKDTTLAALTSMQNALATDPRYDAKTKATLLARLPAFRALIGAATQSK